MKGKVKNKLRNIFFSKVLWYFPKDVAHKIVYKKVMKKKLNIKEPKDYNEKLQYLMIRYGKNETFCSDKYKVREYIKSKNLEDILPKIYGVYENTNKINWEELPEQFVLKTNHGCGCTIVCKDKNELNKKECIKKLNKSLKENYGKISLEYHYANIKPLIICEEYLNDNEHLLPIDYKFSCFSGRAECILVCSERERKLKRTYYDTNWNKLDYTKEVSNEEFKKPDNFSEMIKIAETLSKDFPFVRVDLYNIQGKIYFGELTFSPAAGLNQSLNDKALSYLGELIDLNYKK